MMKSVVRILSIVILVPCMMSCTSSKKNMDELNSMDEKPGGIIPIAPGTAEITARILNIGSEGEDLVCQIRIMEVMEYGMSTPPLPVGSELRLFLSPGVPGEVREKLMIGEEVKLHISHTIGPGDMTYWSLLKIINTH